MKQHARPGSAGFTLIELMAVVLVIIMLIGLVVAGATFAQRKAAIRQTQAEIATIEQAMEDFKATWGFYPAFSGNSGDTNSTQNLFHALRGKPGEAVPLANGPTATLPANSVLYMTFKPAQADDTGTAGMILDPFGEPYRYRVPGIYNPASFDLWSAGPDRKTETNVPPSAANTNAVIDDITNWSRR